MHPEKTSRAGASLDRPACRGRVGAPHRWTWVVQVSWKRSYTETLIVLSLLDEKFAIFTLWQSKWNCDL